MTGSNPGLTRARALLGLGPDPTRSEIVQAFRRRARAVHPDVSAASDAADRFVEVSTAYRLALAYADDRREGETLCSTAQSVAVRYAPSAAFVAPRGPLMRTSPLIWAGPVTVVKRGRAGL